MNPSSDLARDRAKGRREAGEGAVSEKFEGGSQSGNNLSFFLFAKFMEVLGDKFLLFMVPVAVYLATKDVRLSGAVTVMQWLPRVILQPFLSTFVNSLPMRVQFFAIGLTKVALCGSMSLWGDNIPFVLVSVSIVSMLNGCSFINLEAVGGTLKNKSNRAIFQGHVQTIDRTSRILGPAIGGLALSKYGFEIGCLLAALLFLANVCILVTSFKLAPQQRTVKWRELTREVALAARHIFSTPPLLFLLLIMMIGNFLEGILITFLPKLVVTMFHAQTTAIATIEMGAALFTVFLLHVLPRISRNLETAVTALFAPALGLMTASCLLFAFSTNVALLAVAFAGFFAAQSITTIYIRVHRIEYIPEFRFASTMSVALSLVQITLPAAGYLIVILSPVASYRTIIGLGAIFAACAFWAIWRSYCRAARPVFINA